MSKNWEVKNLNFFPGGPDGIFFLNFRIYIFIGGIFVVGSVEREIVFFYVFCEVNFLSLKKLVFI